MSPFISKLLLGVSLIIVLIEENQAIFGDELNSRLFTTTKHLEYSNRIPLPEFDDCSSVFDVFEIRNFEILNPSELSVLDYCLERRSRKLEKTKPASKTLEIWKNTKKLEKLEGTQPKKCMYMLKKFIHEEHVNSGVRRSDPCNVDSLNEYSELIRCTRLFRDHKVKSLARVNYFEVMLPYVAKTMSICLIDFDKNLEKDFREVQDVHGSKLDKITNKLITGVHLPSPVKYLVSVLTGQQDSVKALQLSNRVDFTTLEDKSKLMKRIRTLMEEMYHHNLASDSDHKPLFQNDLSPQENEINLRRIYQYSVQKVCSPLVPFEFDKIFDRYISLFSSAKDVMEELHINLDRFKEIINEGAYFRPIYYSTRACVFLNQNTIALEQCDNAKNGCNFKTYFEPAVDNAEQSYEAIDLSKWP